MLSSCHGLVLLADSRLGDQKMQSGFARPAGLVAAYEADRDSSPYVLPQGSVIVEVPYSYCKRKYMTMLLLMEPGLKNAQCPV